MDKMSSLIECKIKMSLSKASFVPFQSLITSNQFSNHKFENFRKLKSLKLLIEID